jgi:SAM-dependent methyltransferase
LSAKERIKNIVRRYPKANEILKRSHLAMLPIRLKTLFLGTRGMERKWAKRHLEADPGNEGEPCRQEWIRRYWNSSAHPHRALLREALVKYSPDFSLLEIGSNCGTNLVIFAERFPQARFVGVDINPQAVYLGNDWIREKRISNISLEEGTATDLRRFGSQSFDIVMTDAVLLYIGRDRIISVITDLVRIARRAIILCEWHDNMGKDPRGRGVLSNGLWRRNYLTLMKTLVPAERIRITKIPAEVWPETGWREWGAIIEVALGKTAR